MFTSFFKDAKVAYHAILRPEDIAMRLGLFVIALMVASLLDCFRCGSCWVSADSATNGSV